MKSIKVYDNSRTWDRYTVVIGSSCYGMSDNATSPQGFNQYIGELSELNRRAFGNKVQHNSLPLDVKVAIKRRYYAQKKDEREYKRLKREEQTRSHEMIFYIALALVLVLLYIVKN